MLNKVYVPLICLLGLLWMPNAISAQETGVKKPYRLAVFPYLPPREIESLYSMVAKDFSKILGRPVHVRTSTSFSNFLDAISNEEFELAFVQPFDYVELADNKKYRPIASPDELLRGVVVVPKDSDIRTWADMKGKRLALTPKSSAVTRLLLNELKKLGYVPGKDIEIKFYRSHFSCMQQLSIKKADACGTARPAVEFFQNKMKTILREIAQSDPIPSSVFVASPNVSMADVLVLRKRLIDWRDTPEGKELIGKLKLSPFRAVNDYDYDAVRAYGK